MQVVYETRRFNGRKATKDYTCWWLETWGNPRISRKIAAMLGLNPLPHLGEKAEIPDLISGISMGDGCFKVTIPGLSVPENGYFWYDPGDPGIDTGYPPIVRIQEPF